MDRRRYLALLAFGLSGCVGATGDSTPTDTAPTPAETENTPTDTETTPTPRPPVTSATRRDGGTPEWSALPGLESDADPFVTYVVGDPSVRPVDVEPHYVVVENQAEEPREITVTVTDQSADEPAADATLSFPEAGICQLELAEPAAYDVTVTARGETTTVSIAESQFDCNESNTGVFVGPDGTAETETVSTMLGCGTPAS